MSRHVDINSPEEVLDFVAKKQVSEARKEVIMNCYANYCRWKGLSFVKPRYRRVKRLPFIPLENEIDMLISALPRKISVFCQLIKETGARPGEAWNLKWTDINPHNNTITINNPEKNSNPRVIKVSSALISRILCLPRKTEWIFKPNPRAKLKTLARKFQRSRKQISAELHNPRIQKISFLTLRHFKATMEYHKTKDILHVKEMLGHVSIQSTLIYTHLVDFDNNEWISKTAKTLKEACKLIEAGFEYVCDFNGVKIFRKRK